MKNTILFSIIVLSFLFAMTNSCKKKDDTKEKEPFDTKAMLKVIGEEAIKPVHQDFLTQCELLITASDTFANQKDSASLVALQQQYKIALASWGKCEAFNFGSVADFYVHTKINKWPTNTSFIENNIGGSSTINESFIESQGSTVKGFPALEYLIFSTSGNTSVLQSFTNQRRMDYVLALCLNLKTKSAYLVQLWNDYLPDFETNDASNIYGSLSLFINAEASLLEVMVNVKVGNPMGKTNYGTALPDQVEDFLSQESLNDIKNNLIGVRSGYESKGLKTMLDYKEAKKDGQLLSAAIDQKFADCFSAIDAINIPLSQAVLSQSDKTEALYQNLRSLLILFKVDIPSVLGVTITFNDNDGD